MIRVEIPQRKHLASKPLNCLKMRETLLRNSVPPESHCQQRILGKVFPAELHGKVSKS